MDSESDGEKRRSAYAQRKGRVVEDERGRQIWQDTIKTISLSLMESGTFFVSKAQEHLMKFRKTSTDIASNHLDDDLKVIDDEEDFDPYDSTKKHPTPGGRWS